MSKASILVEARALEGSGGIRLSITRNDGSERAEVVYFPPEEEKQFANIQEAIQSLLTEHGRLGLAAVAQCSVGRNLTKILKKRDKRKN